ncbi:MAG: Competence protein ComEA (Modular protein) [candidate division TA06 bacterium 32_111]|uniref:Competence protein ComEA (Modular protein) n=2 Tax=Bacteria candidate phyla TaxID=1783234 RepID=A0A101I403_UNCT6|nr:MAG: Competence protein ComEA (Modular protein) [candidate division TA06 bacterium 32_111]KUK88129.1 MAG: Competence protein ComEA (Modular protein) [candidate division TA06 bacterium 34_109]HAF07059.1 hypothetical protein [candidate division WOR-3 bacterium]HCP16974.1 hypothetical protein [candidate division WOR-3 bacterium]
MKRIYTFLLILAFFSILFSQDKIDINNSDLSALDTLFIPDEVINNIKVYLNSHGEIKSIYELMEIEGVDYEIFSILKEKLTIRPDTSIDSTSIYILRMQDRLAGEENPSRGAIDLWERLLVEKLNVNKVGFEELSQIYGVRLTDVEAIMQGKKSRTYRYLSDLRRTPNLTYYAYSNLRNYVTFKDEKRSFFDLSGYVRTKMKYSNDDSYGYSSFSALANELSYRLTQLEVINPDSVNLRNTLLKAGYTSEEVDSLKSRIESEYSQLQKREIGSNLYNKIILNVGNNLSFGTLFSDYSTIGERNFKGYFQVRNIPFIKNLIFGNYRVTLNDGLIFDNTDEKSSRTYDRSSGLFVDLNESFANNLFGVALEGNVKRLYYILFLSQMKRDGILNRDSTVNLPFLTKTYIDEFTDVYGEKTFGGKIALNIGGIFNLPLVTQIGFSGFNSMFDRNFRQDSLTLDIPFDKDNLKIPVYLNEFSNDRLNVYGINFQTAYKNIFLQGEFALQDKSRAYVIKSGLVYSDFYFVGLLRRYDVGYSNFYSRPFYEQSRYDDTEFEKTYRLIDPLFTYILDDPRPRPEEGIYLETRYRILSNLTLNYTYLDIWRTLDYNLLNYRFQTEIELRPVFPVRIRLKHKIQEKNIYKNIVSTNSVTNETTLRIFTLLSNNDYLNFEARYGMVRLTTGGNTDNSFIDGSFVNLSYEKRITDYFSVLGGFATWNTDGMSQWILEDNGIDFLYGKGDKMYLSFVDRVSDLLSMRMKLSLKNQETTFSGISFYNDKYRYIDSDFQVISDFDEYKNLIGISCQVDIRW